MRFHFLIFLLCFATGFQALEIVNREASSRPDGLHPSVHGDRAGCHNTDSPHTALFGRIPRPGRIDTSIFRLTYLFGIHTRLQDGYFKPMLVNQLWIANFIQLNGATKPKNERLEADHLFELQLFTKWMEDRKLTEADFDIHMAELKAILNGPRNAAYIPRSVNCAKRDISALAIQSTLLSGLCADAAIGASVAYMRHMRFSFRIVVADLARVIEKVDPALSAHFLGVMNIAVTCMMGGMMM